MSRAKEAAISNRVIAIFTATCFLTIFILVAIMELKIIKYDYGQVESKSVRIIEEKENKKTIYYPTYSYEVESEIYMCKGSKSLLKPSQKNRLIFYKKENPTECSLNQEKRYKTILYIALSIIIYFCFVIIMYRNIKIIEKSRKRKNWW